MHGLWFCMSEVISSFRSLRAGSQVFALLMILHTAIGIHLSLWYVVLVCHQYNICENSVGSVYIDGYGGLRCPVRFLVVGECPSVLL